MNGGRILAISFTDEFNIDKQEFLATGAFDVILDVDSRLFIDPALLDLCEADEFKDAREKVERYFADIITLLKHSKNINDMFWKRADELLTFKELTGTCFGYSQYGTSGNSIGPVLRSTILYTIKELISVGETDPSIFELLGVFQAGIGADRISDLLTFILAEEIYKFTDRVISQFSLENTTIKYNNQSYHACINKYNNKAILLLPSSLLSPLLVADSFDDIDLICMENERVRQIINDYMDLGKKKKLTKADIYSLMKSSRSFRTALITAYKSAPVAAYDFKKDPVGEYSWYAAAKKYVAEYPLEFTIDEGATIRDVFLIVQSICIQFKKLIEDNGLWELLYDNDKKTPKHERAAQQLFFGIADAYCTANNLDLTRESNAGRGPVDFKLSSGAKGKVVVEVKLTSNSQLRHGIEKQLPIYIAQEKAQKAIYLIIDNGYPRALENFYDFYNNLVKDTKNKIPFIVVDGNSGKKSASTA